MENLEDLFLVAEAKEGGGGNFGAGGGDGGGGGQQHYLASYKSTAMRQKILINELEDSQKNLQKIVQRKIGIKGIKAMLLKERDEAEIRRNEVEEELGLIEEHLREQVAKQDKAEEDERASTQQIELVKKTIADIGVEVEKSKLLALGSGARIEEVEDK